jgi:hypothetical protein
VNKTFNDFPALMQALIVELCENPAIKIDGSSIRYDYSRHRVQVLVTTNRGDVFAADCEPECERDLLKGDEIPFGSALRCHLAQQLALANSIAAKVHALAWGVDSSRRNQSH